MFEIERWNLMTNLNNKAILNPGNVCSKCLQKSKEHQLNIIHIGEMGYGSGFDSWSTEIHLCDKCLAETNLDWWDLEVVTDCNGFEAYKYDKEIFEYADNLPLASRELFYNHYSTDNYKMDAQDWIDYELELLPHEKCKDYGLYSPAETTAYKERFPICFYVSIRVFPDSSSSSRCMFGAFGDKEGNTYADTMTNACYGCEMFRIREDRIPIIYENRYRSEGLNVK